MEPRIDVDELIQDFDNLDVDEIYSQLPTKEDITRAVEKKRNKQLRNEYCSKIKAVIANNGNGKTPGEILLEITEISQAYI